MTVSASPALNGATPSPLRRVPTESGPQRLDSDFLRSFDASEAFKSLDTDGDGTVSDQEFALYRAQKQARGEFVPHNGPANGSSGAAKGEALDGLLKRL